MQATDWWLSEGRGAGEVVMGRGDQLHGEERKPDFGGEHAEVHTDAEL